MGQMKRWAGWLMAGLTLGCGGPIDLDEDLGPEVSVSRDEVRIANSLPTQALLFNALTTNPAAAGKIAGVPLATASYHALSGKEELRLQLHDPNARTVMRYLVGCALTPAQKVEWQDPFDGVSYAFQGEAGLCPEWGAGPASEQCQQWVSACVLARNNSQAKRVELSVRGQDEVNPAKFALAPQVPTDALRPLLHLAVTSTKACGLTTSGAARNCGWQTQYVGRCAVGSKVKLGAGGVPPSECGLADDVLGETLSGRAVLRVCDGLSACDHADGRRLASAQGSCAGTAPAVEFTCPPNGTFSVMLAPYASNQEATAAVAASGIVRYPASEAQVYDLREGAFFGTIFDPSALPAGLSVFVGADGKIRRPQVTIKGAIYKRMFACHAPEWSSGAAYLTARLCALAGANCAAVAVGSCTAAIDRSGNRRCKYEDGPTVAGDRDFEECVANGKVWKGVVSTQLNAPCDVVGLNRKDTCVRRRQ